MGGIKKKSICDLEAHVCRWDAWLDDIAFGVPILRLGFYEVYGNPQGAVTTIADFVGLPPTIEAVEHIQVRERPSPEIIREKIRVYKRRINPCIQHKVWFRTTKRQQTSFRIMAKVRQKLRTFTVKETFQDPYSGEIYRDGEVIQEAKLKQIGWHETDIDRALNNLLVPHLWPSPEVENDG